MNCLTRRRFVQVAAMAAAGSSIVGVSNAKTYSTKTVPLFDGKTLKRMVTGGE